MKDNEGTSLKALAKVLFVKGCHVKFMKTLKNFFLYVLNQQTSYKFM